ncbi:hypothetical protein GCM10023189_10490 [Nibrella saemangeumensis]|uniref:Peptidase C14 caspase domain-containing protein n=2 Tax=Nibrella saemangeumensis TaxID=1084526 RepID=A0ABP8MIJ6_9BACT
MDAVARSLGYQYNLIVRSNEQFGLAGLNEAVNTVNCQPDDVLFFYFTGHGFSTPKRNNDFPLLYLRTDTTDLAGLHQRLVAKKPRLCISLGDCCNNVLSDLRKILPNPLQIRGLNTQKDTDILRKLFVETKGDVLIATAKRGERAASTPSIGSFYTYSWLNALKHAIVNNNDVTWATLLNDSEQRMQSLLAGFPDTVRHHSHWKINIADAGPPVTPDQPVAPVAPKPVATFDQVNDFLNQLADESKSFAERNALRQRLEPLYFTPTSTVKIYIKSPEKPVELQSITRFLSRMLVNARQVVRINTVERLSDLKPDGRYEVLTVEEVR